MRARERMEGLRDTGKINTVLIICERAEELSGGGVKRGLSQRG